VPAKASSSSASSPSRVLPATHTARAAPKSARNSAARSALPEGTSWSNFTLPVTVTSCAPERDEALASAPVCAAMPARPETPSARAREARVAARRALRQARVGEHHGTAELAHSSMQARPELGLEDHAQLGRKWRDEARVAKPRS
jgi:hypothetical protein